MNDIVLLNDFSPAIADGDFVVAECLNQEVACLLQASKGHFRQHPGLGVGLPEHLLDEQTEPLRREIGLQLRRIGLRMFTLFINNGNILLKAERSTP
ncbi:MAG: hypothetical protein IPM52_13200 [Bacteroidetes bacterium]|nr:hypothetical protein [Bacteroidota bacterium]